MKVKVGDIVSWVMGDDYTDSGPVTEIDGINIWVTDYAGNQWSLLEEQIVEVKPTKSRVAAT